MPLRMLHIAVTDLSLERHSKKEVSQQSVLVIAPNGGQGDVAASSKNDERPVQRHVVQHSTTTG